MTLTIIKLSKFGAIPITYFIMNLTKLKCTDLNKAIFWNHNLCNLSIRAYRINNHKNLKIFSLLYTLNSKSSEIGFIICKNYVFLTLCFYFSYFYFCKYIRLYYISFELKMIYTTRK